MTTVMMVTKMRTSYEQRSVTSTENLVVDLQKKLTQKKISLLKSSAV